MNHISRILLAAALLDNKLEYTAPSAQKLDIASEGMICVSGDLPGYDDAIEI